MKIFLKISIFSPTKKKANLFLEYLQNNNKEERFIFEQSEDKATVKKRKTEIILKKKLIFLNRECKFIY